MGQNTKFHTIRKTNRRDELKTNKVDHICIAVKNLNDARKVWEPVLGKTQPDDEYIDELEKINVARYWIGELGFELMESTSPDGEVAKFIEQKGEGVMVISLNVDDTRQAMNELKDRDYPIIGDPRPFRDCEFTFIHPKKMNGVLLELIDYKWKEFK
jgi:methylmalonyl-CoA/ethylmalonyl-CoA epimerase